MEYEVKDEMRARLENDYTYHKPFGDQVERYADLREAFKWLAYMIVRLTPPSREQSVALTQLELACMATNSAIARNEKEAVEV